MRDLMLFVHVGGLVALSMGVGASIGCKLVALRASSPEVVLALLVAAADSARRMMLPASFLLLVSGMGLVGISRGAYSMLDPWILGAIAAWLASAVVGIRLHAPRSRTTRVIARRLVEAGDPVSDELRSAVRAGLPASLLDTALLGAMVAFMVFKPGL